ncbi:hypothetical protein BGZ60DRAFT_528745 [Tricladium varicosporioides]|nr:hypothetical protein BGZ60DRAFT_528745 [Hymenoscyphus varicosporioides]
MAFRFLAKGYRLSSLFTRSSRPALSSMSLLPRVSKSSYSQVVEDFRERLRLDFPPHVKNVSDTEQKYTMYQKSAIPKLLEERGALHLDPKAYMAAASVFPFRVSKYVVDELIEWCNVPDDPMFRLTFPQPNMLKTEDLDRMMTLLSTQNVSRAGVQEVAERIRAGMNPHPAGQKKENVPRMNGERVDGIQHKYKETVLFFPSEGQWCHTYCTYCFRWAQFTSVGSEQQFKSGSPRILHDYIAAHPWVRDILFTGGDPMVMKSEVFNRYVTPLLESDATRHLQTIRIGTKSLAYWPYRYTTDTDAKGMLKLFEKIVKSGKHLSIQAHFTHPRELGTRVVEEAIRNIQMTGAVIRCQAPLIRGINDDASIWATMWNKQTKLGMIPYYQFVERDTGACDYFGVPLAKAFRIYSDAIAQVPGTARTVRGPSMSAEPGKVAIIGIEEIKGEKVFILKFLQARNPKWLERVFFVKYDPEAKWLNELKAAFGDEERFYEQEYRDSLADLDKGSSGQMFSEGLSFDHCNSNLS